jgi:hypothetical protein
MSGPFVMITGILPEEVDATKPSIMEYSSLIASSTSSSPPPGELDRLE